MNCVVAPSRSARRGLRFLEQGGCAVGFLAGGGSLTSSAGKGCQNAPQCVLARFKAGKGWGRLPVKLAMGWRLGLTAPSSGIPGLGSVCTAPREGQRVCSGVPRSRDLG